MPEPTSSHYEHVSKRFSQAKWFEWARRVTAFLPRSVLRRVMGVIGSCYGQFSSRNVNLLKKNLGLVAIQEAVPGLCRAVYSNFAKTLSDYFYLGTRTKAEALALIDERVGYEHLKAAHQLGRGVLILTAHLGFFELGGLLMTELGFPTVALTLPELNQELTLWRKDYRARWGVETIEVGTDEFAFTSIRHVLSKGCFVAALIDRPSGAHNFPVRMPNGTMLCSGSILLLAILTGCPVVTVAVINKPNGFYRVEAHEPLFFPKTRITPEIIQSSTQRTMDNLIPIIVAHPEQWFQFSPLH